MKDVYYPIIAFLAVFTFSLMATYVLFRFLKSNAIIVKDNWKAGGGLAGFIIILFISYQFMDSWLEKTVFNHAEKYDVLGYVKLPIQGNSHNGVNVILLPDNPRAQSGITGKFHLTDLDVGKLDLKNLKFCLYFERQGFEPRRENFIYKDLEIDHERKHLVIKDTVNLINIIPYPIRQTLSNINPLNPIKQINLNP